MLYMATVKDYRRILEAESEEERLTFAVAGSFLDYVIVDGNGTWNKSLGLRLGEPEVELLEVFGKQRAESDAQEDHPEGREIAQELPTKGGDVV